MLTKEQNERLSRIGPGTPAGDLMRRYWLPIAATSQMAGFGTKPIRVVGEDLVLYRDRSGVLGLVVAQPSFDDPVLEFAKVDEPVVRGRPHVIRTAEVLHRVVAEVLV